MNFNPFTLKFGIYRINLKIKRVIQASTNENFDECYFKVTPWPLEAVIDGGEVREIVKDEGLTLTASRSYDPNEPFKRQQSTKLLWTCECLTKNITGCEDTCDFNKKAPYNWLQAYQNFYLPPAKIQFNAQYKFTLAVDSSIQYKDKNIAPQYSQVTIKVANQTVTEATNYFIECIQNCHRERTLPNELLFLKAKLYGKHGSIQQVNSTKRFQWSCSKGNNSTPYSLQSKKLANLPNHMLAVRQGFFELGTSYSIMLQESGNSTQLAEYSFMTISISYTGDCKIEPESGIKGVTNFFITCDGHDGFVFEYYDKSEEDMATKAAFKGRMLGTSEFLGRLEGVKLTRGNVAVYIKHKDSGIYTVKVIKVKLEVWSVDEDLMDEIMENLTSTIRLEDLSTTMNAVSYITDILPDWVDKSSMLIDLLLPLDQIRLHTVADVKLSVSTMKNVLESLFTPHTPTMDFDLTLTTFEIIKRQVKLLGIVTAHRETSQWIPSDEITQITTNVLDNLHSASKYLRTTSEGMSEEAAGFDTIYLLREAAIETEDILDWAKDILSYIQAPGLPPAMVGSSDKSFQVWAMGNDDDYRVPRMLWRNNVVPIGVSNTLIRSLDKRSASGMKLYFQAATVDRNIFSWSQSDVKSKLVSVSVAKKKKSKYLDKVSQLSVPIYVAVDMEKNLTHTTVSGSAMQLDPSLDLELLDNGVSIHRIDTPPKGLIRIRFLFPATNESLRVLVTENYRPDYAMMTNERGSHVLNSSNPVYPLKHRLVDASMFLYMGILPGSGVPINQSVHYTFEVTLTLCQLWIESQWSTIGCGVSPRSTAVRTVCVCNHLSIIAAAFPVPPQSIDPFNDAKLFLTVLDNPLVVLFVIVLLLIYLLLVLWGRCKDNEDQYKGRVIVLDDNFPEDTYPYLVAVHTSARFNAGTTAHVGIQLTGTYGESRSHILSHPRRKVLKRNSDDWFVIFTSKSLGDIYEIHIWHDNYGSRPEWYCEKIIVYDLTNGAESLFIVDQWLALQVGDHPEARLMIASDQDMRSLKRVFLDNTILGFRDSHTFLSIFVRHPRSEVTRVQRVSILMCFIIVAMLSSIMFYKPDDPDNPTDDYQYDVGTKELIVSVQTTIISSVLTICVLVAFRRSYKISHKRRRTTLHYRKDQFEETQSMSSRFSQANCNQGKSFYDNYVHYVTKYLKGSPLTPVYMQESRETIQKRMHWYIIAWLVCTVVILGSSYLVMLYGLKLGHVQSQKWLTSSVMSLGQDIFVLGPGKIIVIAVLLSVAFQLSTKVDLHGIDVKDVLSSRKNDVSLNYAKLLIKRNHPMYLPLSSLARQELLEKHDIRQKWWSFIDFMSVVISAVVVSSIIYRLWTSHYHGVNHLINMFSKTHRKEFDSVDIEKINNTDAVDNYFEVTLFEVLFNLHWYNDDRLTTMKEEPEGILKYWAIDCHHKMIGKPLVRQVRVVPHECHNPYFTRMKKCLLKWSLPNKDTNVYGEGWEPATYLDTTKEDSPWEYRARGTTFWWTNQRFYGKYSQLYDVSGYYTSIGPTMKLAERTLAELWANSWQDWYTRACFFSSTLYNVNEQTFTQVTLMFEYFVDGSMYTTITVIPVSRVIKFGVWELIFLLYTFYFLFRCGYVINRTGLLEYLKVVTNVVRIFNITLSFLAIVIWCFHHRMSIRYAQQYMKNHTSDSFDFDNFIKTFSLLQVVLSVLLGLVLTATVMRIEGGRRFLNSYYTFVISLIWLYWMTLGLLLTLCVLINLQYLLDCPQYFRIKELIFFKRMTELLENNTLESGNVQIFVAFRTIVMFFIRIFFILLFLYYTRIARAYKLRDSDNFNFVSFILDRLKKCCNRNKK
ncbi:polycystic kidney disease protein 1-like 2 [Macrosteles quadrilineatus]|uniref:polycystic kidney disease protein 1-like 2 n=1 Tax=Macrosteles quadrilineatus TaxID=74068 RepID=UPI0023E08F38|nr:polycystic kidney disease protein 1-like 2 [Macrosteles quadrilineatus]